MSSVDSQPGVCASCGQKLPSVRALHGLCPKCLIKTTVNDRDSTEEDAGIPRNVGGYELLSEVGRGAAGVVFKARDRRLDRIVAIKFLAEGPMASRDAIRRFYLEAKATARLDHPHIVPIVEAGEEQGRLFLAMRWIDSGSLQTRLLRGSMPQAKAAAMMLCVARAVHQAHERGILHRDLKPGNILLDSNDQPFVGDFGLARFQAAESHLTRTGAVLGTPAYMAPEQALGKEATTAADVYSLGAIFYEMLAGHPPFAAESVPQLLRDVAEKEAAFGESFSLDPDLATICLRCLEKEPGRRYASAAALADDLERWRNDEPIQARPVTRSERLRKWARRRPLICALLVVSSILVLTVAIGSPLALLRISQERRKAERSLYAADMNLAAQAVSASNFQQARELLNRHDPSRLAGVRDFRGWEWHYLKRQCGLEEPRPVGRHQARLLSLAFSPDGLTLATTGVDSKLKFWDLTTRTLASEAALGGWGRAAGCITSNLWIVADGSGMIQIWNRASASPEKILPRDSSVHCAVLSSSGGLFAQADGGVVRVTRVSDGASQVTTASAQALAISPDDRLLAAGEESGFIAISEVFTTNRIATWQAHVPGYGPFPSILALQFTSNGQIVSSGLDGAVKVWSIAEGRLIAALTNHAAYVSAMALSPNGRILATGSGDQTIRLWDTAAWEQRRVLISSHGEIGAISFDPKGDQLAAGSRDGEVEIWDVRNAESQRAADNHSLPEGSWNWVAPDGSTLLTTEPGFQLTWRDAKNPELNDSHGIQEAPASPDSVPSPNGRLAAAANADGNILLIERTAGKIIHRLAGHRTYVDRLLFSYDGALLASHGYPEGLSLWDVASGRWRRSVESENTFCTGLDFSRDKHWLAASFQSGSVSVWNLRSGHERRWRVSIEPLIAAAFSPDNRSLATAGSDGWVKLWNITDQRELARMRGSLLMLFSLAWSPDGLRLAAGTGEGAIKLWDTSALPPLEVASLNGGQKFIRSLQFTGDGKSLISAGKDSLHIWRGQ